MPPGVRELALLQAGVVTREQVLGLGYTRAGLARQVSDGAWQRLVPGIYVTAAGPVTWPARAWAGVLVGGDRARLGGQAAAFLHGLVETEPRLIEVLVPVGSRPRVDGPWQFRRERPGARLASTRGSPPRIGIEDTVLDLIADPDVDERTATHWVTMAVQSRRTTGERIARAADQRHFFGRRRLLARILDDVRVGVRSPLEQDYLHQVERAHDLPAGRRQVGRRSTEVDVLYEEFALIVELDGRLGHTGMGRFRDMRRDNASTTDGLATLRYGKVDVFGRPCDVAREVAVNLQHRGWAGWLARCPRCRATA